MGVGGQSETQPAGEALSSLGSPKVSFSGLEAEGWLLDAVLIVLLGVAERPWSVLISTHTPVCLSDQRAVCSSVPLPA